MLKLKRGTQVEQKAEPKVTRWKSEAPARAMVVEDGKPKRKLNWDKLERGEVFYNEEGLLAICLDNPHYTHSTREWSIKVAPLDRRTILREFEKGVRE